MYKKKNTFTIIKTSKSATFFPNMIMRSSGGTHLESFKYGITRLDAVAAAIQRVDERGERGLST